MDSVAFVSGAAAELDAIGTTDLRRTAVVDEKFKKDAFGPVESLGDAATIHLVEYSPNYLKYETSAPTDGMAVFSEIYYDKGWTAYVDGKKSPWFRADYILRAMVVPEGKHTVEWRFRAPRFAMVEGITLAASIAVLLWLAAALLLTFKFQISSRKHVSGR